MAELQKRQTMDRLSKLVSEISKLTLRMESDYPELYRNLDENPMTLPALGHPEIGMKVLENYLQSLKGLLEHHLQTHKAPPGGE